MFRRKPAPDELPELSPRGADLLDASEYKCLLVAPDSDTDLTGLFRPDSDVVPADAAWVMDGEPAVILVDSQHVRDEAPHALPAEGTVQLEKKGPWRRLTAMRWSYLPGSELFNEQRYAGALVETPPAAAIETTARTVDEPDDPGQAASPLTIDLTAAEFEKEAAAGVYRLNMRQISPYKAAADLSLKEYEAEQQTIRAEDEGQPTKVSPIVLGILAGLLVAMLIFAPDPPPNVTAPPANVTAPAADVATQPGNDSAAGPSVTPGTEATQ